MKKAHIVVGGSPPLAQCVVLSSMYGVRTYREAALLGGRRVRRGRTGRCNSTGAVPLLPRLSITVFFIPAMPTPVSLRVPVAIPLAFTVPIPLSVTLACPLSITMPVATLLSFTVRLLLPIALAGAPAAVRVPSGLMAIPFVIRTLRITGSATRPATTSAAFCAGIPRTRPAGWRWRPSTRRWSCRRRRLTTRLDRRPSRLFVSFIGGGTRLLRGFAQFLCRGRLAWSSRRWHSLGRFHASSGIAGTDPRRLRKIFAAHGAHQRARCWWPGAFSLRDISRC